MASWDTSIRVQIIRNEVPRYTQEIKGGLQRGVNMSADRIKWRAKNRAKVDTGYMRDSVHVEDSNLNLGTNNVGAQVVSPAFYSGFLDMGTRYIAADHWFTGAVEEEKAAYGDNIRRFLFGAGEGKLS